MPRLLSIKPIPASIPYIDEPQSEFTESWGVQLFIKASFNSLVGWGEVLVYGSGIVDAYIGVINVIASLLRDIDVNSVNDAADMVDKMEKVLFTGGLCGVVSGAIGGVEMAILDGLAKSLNVNIGDLLGHRSRDNIPVYASFPRYSRVEDVVKAVDKALDRGFTMVKLHQPVKNVGDAIRAVREAYGYDLRVALDLNAPFNSVDKALGFISSINRYELYWVEEPLWPPNDYDMLRELTRKSPVPITAGENEYTLYGFRRLMESGVAYVQPDISKVGGVLRFMRIVKEAENHGIQVAPHLRPHRSMLAHVFTLHVASVLGNVSIVEWPLAPPPGNLFNPTLTIRNGTIEVPGNAGVGVNVNEELLLAQYAYHLAERMLRFSDLEH